MPKDMLTLMEDWRGYESVHSPQKDERHEQKLLEVVDLLTNKSNLLPHKREYLLREAMSTSDFPYLFGDVLDRALLAGYKDTPQVMPLITKSRNPRDFRTVYAYQVSDGDQRLTEVEELGEYPQSDRDETRYSWALKKYGRQFRISWEAIINDDLGALNDTMSRFAKAARRAEEYFLTTLFFNAAGPLDTYFAASGGAGSVASTALTVANLETAIEAMAAYTDEGSSPIMNQPKYLMVPPALKLTALQILKSSEVTYMSAATSPAAATAFPHANVIQDYNLTLLVNPWIPIVCTTGTIGQTTWALFSDPNDIPAAEFGRLRGREAPELFMKAANQSRVGGGTASPMDGDFDTDAIFYKVRHCFGGVALNPRAGYASDGQ